MTTPSPVPPSAPAPQQPAAPVTNDVLETAVKVQRVRSFAKKSFEKVGVPALIGSASALVTSVVLKRRASEDGENYDTVSDPTE